MTADLGNYDTVLDACRDWRERQIALKAAHPPADFTWYGWEILANAWHLDALLDADRRDLLARIAGQPIADIGAADGDLGFFLESLGFEVDLIDWPATNWNGLRGARRLKQLLGSNAAIHEIDLDSQFQLPRQRYGLVCLLGILYHLKNPYYMLERLAERTRYCMLSTRVARQTADGSVRLDAAPVAYLLAPDECNNDATNFWIFSMPGLLRLVDRCGWTVVAQRTVGDTVGSDPSGHDHDERAFLLLESRSVAGAAAGSTSG
jgi:2-polyprenyl-3-methyl-5-hydroxy-6-metoxy-1,4-benzoquinol methylase